jgi:CBS domain-containing protein
MTPSVETARPDDSLRTAAEMMRDQNIGALPVCDGDRLCGMITDRDLVVRGIAEGLSPDAATVRQVMTEGIFFIFDDQSISEAAELMQEIQIRRLPVLNEKKRLIGIISMKDVAGEGQKDILSGKTLRKICSDAA